MSARVLLIVAIAFLAASKGQAAGLPRTIVPCPKEQTWSQDAPVEIGEDEIAIVLGRQASEPEHYAAELLRDSVLRRFGQTWRVTTEDESTEAFPFLILMGQTTTNQILQETCAAMGVVLNTDSPGHDGYIIECRRQSGKLTVIVGGSNARGVVYGADTLFQMLDEGSNSAAVQLHQASIRDFPTIPWRGRPQTNVENHFGQGVLDAYARCRINFTDLRSGIYAFPADYQFTESDRERIGKAIKECHRRGLLVYGSVDVGIPRSLHQEALKRFSEFIEMGVDGLWLSFDDHGPGEAAEMIVSEILELGRRHGIGDHLIATTPPKGSYQRITHDDHGDRPGFNKDIAAIPGMEKALWFFTCLPSKEALEQARSLGLKTRPAWWHNWPRANSGFTHASSGSALTEGTCYGELFPLSVGWHQPTDELLRANGKYIEAIMPWGGGNWDHYWVISQIGWFGWNPENYRWNEIQQRVFDVVFGPTVPETVVKFNDCLVAAERLCRFPLWGFKYKPQAPPYLKDVNNREELSRLLDRMEFLLQEIKTNACQGSLLAPEHVADRFMKPMEQVIQIGRAVESLSFPEQWYEDTQRQILQAVYAGDLQAADQVISDTKPRIICEANAIAQGLSIHRTTDKYVQWWLQRAEMNAEDWVDLVQQRHDELLQFAWRYNYYQVLRKNLLVGIHDFPDGWGVGGAKGSPAIQGTYLPSNREYFNGTWYAGTFKDAENNVDLIAFLQSTDRANGEPGNYAELDLSMPLGQARQNLAIMFFMNRDVKNKVGHYYAREMWAGHTFLQVLHRDQILWEEDIGISRHGREWSLVHLPTLPAEEKEVHLRLRILDRKRSPGMRGFVLMGSIYLVQIPEDAIDRY